MKWISSAGLVAVLSLAIGVNDWLFSPNTQGSKASPQGALAQGSPQRGPLNRFLASSDPLWQPSWEKTAFQTLEKMRARELTHVGIQPKPFEQFVFGTLAGHYFVREIDKKIYEIQFSERPGTQPKQISTRKGFISQHLALFSQEAKSVKKIHVQNNGSRLIERFQLMNSSGQDLGVIQLILDKDQKLLSMTRL